MCDIILCLNATSTVNLLETYLMRRCFSVEPINVSSLNLVKVMSCQLLIKLQSDIRLSSGYGFTFTVMFKHVHYTECMED